ncbi:MAG TPA: DUF3187 family protein [Anaeromyxobacteraceae bacterium]|jgi:hypothetical protein|nr:DUF3187 family protein [Anaeromyxobacteraceae bacterium]
MTRALPLLLAAALALPARGDDRRELAAPLGLGTDGTIRELFLDMPIADARAPRAGLEVRWSMANDWSTPTYAASGAKVVLIQTDEQSDSLAFTLRVPWSRLLGPGPAAGARPLFERLSTTVDWRLTQHWGGWSDGAIEWWHRFAGFYNFERDRYPRNQLHLSLGQVGGRQTIDLHSAQLSFGDVALRTQYLLAEGGAAVVPGQTADARRWGLSARLDLKAPVGMLSRMGGSGGFDAGVGLLGSWELSSFLVGHAMATAQYWSGFAGEQPLQPLGFHWSAEVSLALLLGPVALVLEDRVVSAMFDDTGWRRVSPVTPVAATAPRLASSAWFATFRAQNGITGGLRWGRFTLWFAEDWTPGSNPTGVYKWFYDSNAPDVEIGLGYAQPL